MITLAELYKLQEFLRDFIPVISRIDTIVEQIWMDIGGEYRGNTLHCISRTKIQEPLKDIVPAVPRIDRNVDGIFKQIEGRYDRYPWY